MSDLKSWNIVNIDDLPESVDVEALPDFGLHDGDAWVRVHRKDPDTGEWDALPSAADLSGWYHCTPFDIGEWAKEFTAVHSGVTVTWYEEFRMDDVGESSTVYRAGERVAAESQTSRMVPDNLNELVDEARALITEYQSPDPAQSLTHHYSQKAPALAAALEALVKALA